ncbi:VRR-NUC domain-containing protein [Lacrimispora brassicae]
MQESVIEKKLRTEAKKRNGIAAKFISPGLAGVPDRLLLLPGGKCAFVELKAPGKRLRPLQAKRKKQLEGLGFQVYCIDDIGRIGGVLDAVLST